jgi:hypothetical protein
MKISLKLTSLFLTTAVATANGTIVGSFTSTSSSEEGGADVDGGTTVLTVSTLSSMLSSAKELVFDEPATTITNHNEDHDTFEEATIIDNVEDEPIELLTSVAIPDFDSMEESEKPVLMKERFKIRMENVFAERWSGKDISIFDKAVQVHIKYEYSLMIDHRC